MLPFFLNVQSSTGAPIKFYLRSVAQFSKGAFIALTPARWVNLVPSALLPYFLLLKGNTNILCKATEIFQLINRSAVNTRERQFKKPEKLQIDLSSVLSRSQKWQ